ncbi:RNA polymerase factor sigma-54 [Fusobacterium sp. SB021]|uniref:RNA polymerase factor sigma-54 n=1 Tax=Fusobacterium sp. SB021 TaxID=2744227 RepID=UPI003CFB6951
MDFSLNIKQELKLILTQEMKLSLNVLEMSSMDLEKFIEKEFSKNPLLEIDFSSKNYSSKGDDSEESSPFDFISEEKNLIDFLEEQLGFLKISKEMRFLCTFIVNNLDKRGFLTVTRDELKSACGFPLKDIDKAIEIVKSLEPIGIGAKNLEECLIIQLHKKNINDQKLEYIITHFMQELASSKYDIICSKLNITEEYVVEYLKIIRSLNPFPSRGFYMGDTIRYIEPDAEIKNIGGKYVVVMSEKNIPKLKLKSLENAQEISGEMKNYFNSANNIIRCIEKRQLTLKSILDIILEKQYEYFSKPEGKLNSLTLKDISSILKIHDSTVSRAIKNKYILTERGMKRVKDMFIIDNKKLFVKEKIEELILNEDRYNPLHDNEIALLLEKENLKIARRTVVKYREELGIKPAHKRKLTD